MTVQAAAGQVKLILAQNVAALDNSPMMKAIKLVLSVTVVERQNVRDVMAPARISPGSYKICQCLRLSECCRKHYSTYDLSILVKIRRNIMLNKIIKSYRHFFSRRLMRGYGACSDSGCGCGQYTDAGNSYCSCGHSFDNHW